MSRRSLAGAASCSAATCWSRPRCRRCRTSIRAGCGRAIGLGLAKWYAGDHELWGHGGNGFGTHSGLWYLPKERVTVAVAWNDDAIDDDDGQIVPALVNAVGD